MLGKIDDDVDDYVNFYAVIIDASFPYKDSTGCWNCHLKVVDSTMNISGDDEDFASVLITSTKFQDLPICQRVGDIIRCHRGIFRKKDE